MRWLMFCLFLCGCYGTFSVPNDFIVDNYVSKNNPDMDLYRLIKITDSTSPIHTYIEGDGYSFDKYGKPTTNPTPRGTLLRNIAVNDKNPNVVYIARPCQFIMDSKCSVSDWTVGRFSKRNINSMTNAILDVAKNHEIVLIGYSGGALMSGLVINQNKLNVIKWITIAGVLNHSDWTNYFGDTPLNESLDMTYLPNINQTHFVAENDDIVPFELSKRWLHGKNIVIVPNSRHYNFDGLKIF